jgi:RecA-family ATPase
VVTEVETAMVNIIANTPVRGYEIFAQEVTRTKNGYYRAWIGLRLPLGEFNKMYDYTIQEVVDSHKIKLKAAEAFKSVEDTAKKKKEGNNE